MLLKVSMLVDSGALSSGGPFDEDAGTDGFASFGLVLSFLCFLLGAPLVAFRLRHLQVQVEVRVVFALVE